MLIIFIEGNVAAGKTSLLQNLKNHPKLKTVRVQYILEPVDKWQEMADNNGKNLLSHFYTDQKRFAYSFQSYAFLSRVRMMDEINPLAHLVFIERSVFSDREVFAKNCYEKGMMLDIEWKLYNDWFDWMTKKCLSGYEYRTIYLKAKPETCLNRLKNRGRVEESSVTLEYLKDIHQKHEEWLSSNTDVLVIDSEATAHEIASQTAAVASKLLNESFSDPDIDLSRIHC